MSEHIGAFVDSSYQDFVVGDVIKIWQITSDELHPNGESHINYLAAADEPEQAIEMVREVLEYDPRPRQPRPYVVTALRWIADALCIKWETLFDHQALRVIISADEIAPVDIIILLVDIRSLVVKVKQVPKLT